MAVRLGRVRRILRTMGSGSFASVAMLALLYVMPTDSHAQQSIDRQFRPNVFQGEFSRFRDESFSTLGVVDVDNDGRLDLVGDQISEFCHPRNGCETVFILIWIRNNGSKLPFGSETDVANNRFMMEVGTDWESIPSIVPAFPIFGNARALGDIDGDGDIDVVFNDYLSGLYLSRNSGGQPLFDFPVQLTTSSPAAYQFVLADLDRDGDLDIVGNSEERPAGLYVQYNLGSATEFGPFSDASSIGDPQPRLDSASYIQFFIDDVDGDGNVDIAVKGRNSPLFVLINNGSSLPFTDTTPVQVVGPDEPGSSFSWVAMLDGDGDNDLDVVAVTDDARFGTGAVIYLENQGPSDYFGGPDSGELIFPSESVHEVRAADLNDDGRDDVVLSLSTTDSSSTLLLLNGGGARPFDGTAVPVLSESGPLAFGSSFGVGDFDGDGDTDIFAARFDEPGLYLNNGFTGASMPVISTSYPARVGESDGSVDITFTLDVPPTRPVRFQFGSTPGTASAGEDYFGVFEVVEFLPGETEKSVRIVLLDDDIPEDPETLKARLAFVQGANLAAQTVNIFIDSDDTQPLELRLGDAFATEADGVLEFPVELSRAVNLPVSVSVATQDRSEAGYATRGEDYYGRSEVITIPAGETRAVFRVSVLSDYVGEDDEKVLVRLYNPRNATIVKTDALGVIKNTIDDLARARFDDGFVEIAEGIGTYEFTVKLDRVPNEPVSIRVATRAIWDITPGADYYGMSTTLTFDGTDEASGSVTILDDSEVESRERFQLRLYNPSAGLRMSDISMQYVVIVDND